MRLRQRAARHALACASAFVLWLVPAAVSAQGTPGDPNTGRLTFTGGVDAPTVISRHDGTLVRTISGIDVHVVAVPAGTGLQKIDELNGDPEVKYAEADQVVRAVQAAGPSGGC